MNIEKLNMTIYRTIEDLSLTFNKGLNVLIGENNSGKTAIIERIFLGFGSKHRDMYVKGNRFPLSKKHYC